MKKLISMHVSGCLALILILGGLSGCNSATDRENAGEAASEDSTVLDVPQDDSAYYPKAFASINPASGSDLQGTASFTDQGDGQVTLEISVINTEPGEHAVHLHENGDCSGDDAVGAGGHWAPLGNPHGKRNVDLRHHKGDLANLIVEDDRSGTLTMTVLGWSVGGPDSTNILHKSVVIHEGPDDFTTQPAGDAGARIGCGIIVGVE